MKQLIIGGARSGKSLYAETQTQMFAEKNQQQLIYLATATMNDSEMTTRVQQHQLRRSDLWQLVEEPLDLASVINTYNTNSSCILIDCLTLWLTNCLMQKNSWPLLKDKFIEAFMASEASIFLVSNEVGSGVVPMGELSRQFVDETGSLHQLLGTLCDQLTLVVAGFPMQLKA